jgi:hypothetical protein
MKVFAAPNPSKIDSLAFAIKNPYSHPTGAVPALADLRLFTTSGGKDLLEWDIPSGTIKVSIGLVITDSYEAERLQFCRASPTRKVAQYGPCQLIQHQLRWLLAATMALSVFSLWLGMNYRYFSA